MNSLYPKFQNIENKIKSGESLISVANTNESWETSSSGFSPRIMNQDQIYSYNHGPSNDDHNNIQSRRNIFQQQPINNRAGPLHNNISYSPFHQQHQVQEHLLNKSPGTKSESSYKSNIRGHSSSMDSGYNMIAAAQQNQALVPPMDMSSWGNDGSSRSVDRDQLFSRNDSGSQVSQTYVSPTLSHNHNSPLSLSSKSINAKDTVEEDPIMSNIYFNTTKNTWDCGICRKSFCEKNDLFQHLRSGTHEPKRFSCSDCGKAFASIGALAQHVEQSGHSRGNKTLLQEVDHFGSAVALAAASAATFDRRNLNNNHNIVQNNMPLIHQQHHMNSSPPSQQQRQQSMHQNFSNNSNNYSQDQYDNYNNNSNNSNGKSVPASAASRVRFYSGPEFVSHHNHHIPPTPPPQPHHHHHNHHHQSMFSSNMNGNNGYFPTNQSIHNNNHTYIYNSNDNNTNSGNVVGHPFNKNTRFNGLNNPEIAWQSNPNQNPNQTSQTMVPPIQSKSEKSFAQVNVFNNMKSISPDRALVSNDVERRRTISYPDQNLIHNHRPIMPATRTFSTSSPPPNPSSIIVGNNGINNINFQYASNSGQDAELNSLTNSIHNNRSKMNQNISNNSNNTTNTAAMKDSSTFYSIEELEIDMRVLDIMNNRNIDGTGDNNTNNHTNHDDDDYYEMPLTPTTSTMNEAKLSKLNSNRNVPYNQSSRLLAAVTETRSRSGSGINVAADTGSGSGFNGSGSGFNGSGFHGSGSGFNGSGSGSGFNGIDNNSISHNNSVSYLYDQDHSCQLPLYEPEYTLYFSGASQPRSLFGVAAFMIRDDRNDIIIAQGTQQLVQIYTGSMRPEYEGLNLGLTEAYQRGITKLHVAGDSELVFMHLNTGSELRFCQSVYRVVQDISKQVRMMCCNFHEISFDLILKEDNKAVPLAVLEMAAAFK